MEKRSTLPVVLACMRWASENNARQFKPQTQPVDVNPESWTYLKPFPSAPILLTREATKLRCFTPKMDPSGLSCSWHRLRIRSFRLSFSHHLSMPCFDTEWFSSSSDSVKTREIKRKLSNSLISLGIAQILSLFAYPIRWKLGIYATKKLSLSPRNTIKAFS